MNKNMNNVEEYDELESELLTEDVILFLKNVISKKSKM